MKLNKNLVKVIFINDLYDIADGFKETMIFLVNLVLFILHVVLAPYWISLAVVRYFRWKYDKKYIDEAWEYYLKFGKIRQ